GSVACFANSDLREDKEMPTRRDVLAAGLAAVSAAPFTTPALAQLTPFKAGIADPVNTVLAWWMADAAGFYKAQGLDVRVVDMPGGARGAPALQSAQVGHQ